MCGRESKRSGCGRKCVIEREWVDEREGEGGRGVSVRVR
jgi:hypothetical protein